jgi:hypothetical protein
MNKTRFDWDSDKDAENQKKRGVIRIFGAGYWLKGKAMYERKN